MPDVTIEKVVVLWVRVHCPWRNHDLRFEVPQGSRFRAKCHSCGREFERVA
jgi:hypothetical protein